MANQLITLTEKPADQAPFSVRFDKGVGEPAALISEASQAVGVSDKEIDLPVGEETSHDTVIGTLRTAIHSGCKRVFVEDKGGNVKIHLYK